MQPLLALVLAWVSQLIFWGMALASRSKPRQYLMSFLIVLLLAVNLYGISAYGSLSARGIIFLPVISGWGTLFWRGQDHPSSL